MSQSVGSSTQNIKVLLMLENSHCICLVYFSLVKRTNLLSMFLLTMRTSWTITFHFTIITVYCDGTTTRFIVWLELNKHIDIRKLLNEEGCAISIWIILQLFCYQSYISVCQNTYRSTLHITRDIVVHGN